MAEMEVQNETLRSHTYKMGEITDEIQSKRKAKDNMEENSRKGTEFSLVDHWNVASVVARDRKKWNWRAEN